MSPATVQIAARAAGDKKESNSVRLGAVIILIIIVIVGVMVTLASPVSNNKPVTMTPGSGNGLTPSAVAVTAAPSNIK